MEKILHAGTAFKGSAGMAKEALVYLDLKEDEQGYLWTVYQIPLQVIYPGDL